MATIQNGELLKEIYDKVNEIKVDVGVLVTRSDTVDKTLDRHESELDWLKKKILPIMGGAIVIAYLIKLMG